jgi:predicted secreted acid phosphatase
VGLDYDIKLLIGDQLRDFDEVFRIRMEGFGKPQVDAMRDSLMRQFVIVPNTMYGTWRDVVSGKGTDAEKYAAVQRFFKVNARP